MDFLFLENISQDELHFPIRILNKFSDVFDNNNKIKKIKTRQSFNKVLIRFLWPELVLFEDFQLFFRIPPFHRNFSLVSLQYRDQSKIFHIVLGDVFKLFFCHLFYSLFPSSPSGIEKTTSFFHSQKFGIQPKNFVLFNNPHLSLSFLLSSSTDALVNVREAIARKNWFFFSKVS